ncbi:MAG: YeeE/YedE thiosulfate transporter family protein [Acidobacteria bacterium]|nr:YeeE/YedE thiosulfate transporter family protein [Acidobacteriota bacterium]
MTTTTGDRRPQAYTNPYLAGIGLGLVLLSSFVLVGRGLGASGAFNSVIAWAVNAVAPAHARSNEFIAGYLGDGSASPLKSWLVFEVIGVFAGAMLSGLLAGRTKVMTEKGPRVSVRMRLAMAFAGGILMAFGAALARGCTSGQALTGGALLNLGSWVFMMMVFAGAYAVAYFVRWQWR